MKEWSLRKFISITNYTQNFQFFYYMYKYLEYTQIFLCRTNMRSIGCLRQTGALGEWSDAWTILPKTGRLLFRQPMLRKIIFFRFFLLDKWITYCISFLRTPSTSNSNSLWARGEFLFRMDFKFIFLVYFEELLHVAMWLKLLKG
jgi:hypothetical protein